MDDDLVKPDNPLLPTFAAFHDYYERFLHALERIVAGEDDPVGIAKEAIDVDTLIQWEAEGRPLPHIDVLLGKMPAEIHAYAEGLLKP